VTQGGEPSVRPAAAAVNRLGGVSAVLFGIAYVVIIGLYAVAGAPPRGAEAWLAYAPGKTTVWWAIVALSVLTDFLLIPIGLALYRALHPIDRIAAVFGTAVVALFVVLDLAVTWPNYAVRIAAAEGTTGAASEAVKAAYLAAATYASTVLTSTLEGVYSIVTLSIGILLLGWAMRRSPFGRTIGYLGVVTGVLGVVAVAGPVFSSLFDPVIIVTSLLTTVWVPLAGYRLLRTAPA
jgi:hypothetical protein